VRLRDVWLLATATHCAECTDLSLSLSLQAADKDRAWDDWKDNNPKGWGNKMGKRF
jgi:hypothetical protein